MLKSILTAIMIVVTSMAYAQETPRTVFPNEKLLCCETVYEDTLSFHIKAKPFDDELFELEIVDYDVLHQIYNHPKYVILHYIVWREGEDFKMIEVFVGHIKSK